MSIQRVLTDRNRSLVWFREGNSVDIGAAILDIGIPAISNITIAIYNKTFDALEPKTHDQLRLASNWVNKRKLELEIEANDELNIKGVRISKNDPIPPPSTPDFTVDGQTTVWGYLTKVGGEKPRALLNFPDKSKVILSADEPVAKDIAGHLYEEVGIEGIATWRSRDWKLIAFRAFRVLEYRPSIADAEQTFKDLAVASEGRWNGVDAEEYVKNLRDEQP